MGKPKLKKQMKGGSLLGKSIVSKTGTKSTFDPLNILLLGLLAFLIYHMRTLLAGYIKEKVIVREVVKEVDDQPYREDL